ncbi:hypothetical protein [Nocardia fusca]|uniref:Uncharacterized protein n=1 Tax=Nocardia fusca TaxID=941183 RepID=A0ABV3FCH9_9NOCA
MRKQAHRRFADEQLGPGAWNNPGAAPRALLVGPDAGLGDRARAIVALGSLSDCLVLLADTPVEELRVAALDAACAALDRRPPAADSAASAR